MAKEVRKIIVEVETIKEDGDEKEMGIAIKTEGAFTNGEMIEITGSVANHFQKMMLDEFSKIEDEVLENE